MNSVAALCSNHRIFSKVQVTELYRRVDSDSTQALNNFILTALAIQLLFQILTTRIQAFQANDFLISKSFVQFSSQDPKYLKSLTSFIVPVETRNSMGDV
jgi:alkyl sulfatase BDS1-like metallo-beta-lactamase superfamily hydrolase